MTKDQRESLFSLGYTEEEVRFLNECGFNSIKWLIAGGESRLVVWRQNRDCLKRVSSSTPVLVFESSQAYG